MIEEQRGRRKHNNMPKLISITKIEVQNLQVADMEEPDLFRVVLRAGAAIAKTKAKRPNLDGSVQWTERLEIMVYDTTVNLVAAVQQCNFREGWVIGADSHFSSSSLASLPNKWLHTSDLPAAPKFYAELNVDGQGDTPPAVGTDKSERNSMIDTPFFFSSAGNGDAYGGDDMHFPPSSVTTSESTVATSSVGGGFFGSDSEVGICLEGSTHSSALSASQQLPMTREVTSWYDYVLHQSGAFGAATGAKGAVVPSRPELATSQPISSSPPASPPTRFSDAPKIQQQSGASGDASSSSRPGVSSTESFSRRRPVSPIALADETGKKNATGLTSSAPFSRLPLVSPVTIISDDLTMSQQLSEAGQVSTAKLDDTDHDDVGGHPKVEGIPEILEPGPMPIASLTKQEKQEAPPHSEETNPSPEDFRVTRTLGTMFLPVRGAGGAGEGGGLIRQALPLKKTNLGADNLPKAVTLLELGRCMREAKRLGEAEGHFKLALKIFEANLGPQDLQVAWTLQELERCVREAGRPEEAEQFLKRAIQIQKDELGPHHTNCDWTLYDLRRCVEQAALSRDIEEIVKQVDDLLSYLQRRMSKHE